MIVIDKLECAFMPICKAGSSSLIVGFAEEVYDSEYISSQKIELGYFYNGIIRKKMHQDFNISPCGSLTKEKLKTYFKFSFIKNPWHRMVSACLQFRRWINNNAQKDDFKALKLHKIYDLMNHDYSFENFVNFVKNIERNHTEYVNHHWRSQVGILQIEGLPSCQVEYDFIGKLESVQEDYSFIANKLNLKSQKMPQINKHESDYNYRDFYTNTKLIDDVGEYYTRDIDIFKYEFGK